MSARVWAVRMSANWVDIRSGDRPKRVITYLTSEGRRLQNVAHVGGKAICCLSVSKLISGVYPYGQLIPVPALHTVREVTGEAAEKYGDPRWRRDNGL